MKKDHKFVKFQTFLNLFLVTVFVLGLLTLAPDDAKANLSAQTMPVGALEISQGSSLAFFVPEGEVLQFNLDVKDAQDGQAYQWTVIRPPVHGKAALLNPGESVKVRYTADLPGESYAHRDYFLVQVQDSAGQTAQVNVSVLIKPEAAPTVPDQRWSSESPAEVNRTSPVIAVYPQNYQVSGYDWPPNTSITLTIGTEEWTEVSTSWGTVVIFTHPTFLVKGMELEMTDGTTTRHHTITLEVTDIDQDNDTVSGKANPGNEVEIYAFSDGYFENLFPYVDEFGNWVADFSIDISEGVEGWATEYDQDGNSTHIHWFVPKPSIHVYPQYNDVFGELWPPDVEITLKIDDDVELKSQSFFDGFVNFWNHSLEITPGQVITMTDGTTTRTHIVMNIDVTNVDYDTNTVSGTADLDSVVSVRVCADRRMFENMFYQECIFVDQNTDSSGMWVVNFSDIMGDPPISRVHINAKQVDKEGNSTEVFWFDYFYSIYLPLIIQ